MTDLDDLRRSDGSIDARMILEGRVETLQDASDPTVSPEMCAELRHVARGRNVPMIAEDYPVDRTVICRHVAWFLRGTWAESVIDDDRSVDDPPSDRTGDD